MNFSFFSRLFKTEPAPSSMINNDPLSFCHNLKSLALHLVTERIVIISKLRAYAGKAFVQGFLWANRSGRPSFSARVHFLMIIICVIIKKKCILQYKDYRKGITNGRRE